tara:strand:+ start:264 stop:440 length:177 start_codon:yes stop_codon:yes gene_type:complete
MESNKISTANFKETVNRHEKFISIENLNYLYPNGHIMTPQARWFKLIQDRGLRSDLAA